MQKLDTLKPLRIEDVVVIRDGKKETELIVGWLLRDGVMLIDADGTNVPVYERDLLEYDVFKQ